MNDSFNILHLAFKALKLEKNKEDIKSAEGSFPKDVRTNEIQNEIEEIKKWKEKTKIKGLKYETRKYIYDFK